MLIRDFIHAKNAPTLHLIKALEAIEKKVFKHVEREVQREMDKVFKDIKTTGISEMSDIASAKMNEMKENVKGNVSLHMKILENEGKTKGEVGKTPIKGVDYFDGKKGDQGKQGDAPVKGVDYFDGEKGETPVKGVDYFDGDSPSVAEVAENLLANKSFLKKTKGEEGSPDTEKQIANKLNKTEQSVAIKVIKGLPEALKNLRTLARKKGGGGKSGGGMGTIKFFKFTGDGATTEFTLPDLPTQEGAAVFAFTQSGRLHNDEHFTVSGMTLTTTYTPLDGEIIDGHIIT